MSGPPSLRETIGNNPEYFGPFVVGAAKVSGAIDNIRAAISAAPSQDRAGLIGQIMAAIMGVVPSSMTPVKSTEGGRRTRHHKSKRGHKKHRTTRRR